MHRLNRTISNSFRLWLPLLGQQLDSSITGHRFYVFNVEEGMFTRQFSVRGIVRQNEKMRCSMGVSGPIVMNESEQFMNMLASITSIESSLSSMG
ncbi:hypothetical protein CIP107544_02163 [Corynebacterium diphtheriae]|nr:hypothetical protein CIP107544_02163 [Corynebacterium diphtheriae]